MSVKQVLQFVDNFRVVEHNLWPVDIGHSPKL